MKPIDPTDNIEIHGSICDSVKELYRKKNADYGNSFAGLRHRYPNFVCMRIFDKLNRLDNIMKPGYECKVSEETIEDTLMDIANYAIMELTERRLESYKQDPESFKEGSSVSEAEEGVLFEGELPDWLDNLIKNTGGSLIVLNISKED